MRWKIGAILIGLLVGSFLIINSLHEKIETVTVLSNESMPFQGLVDGKPTGIAIDLLEEITRRDGPKFEYHVGLPLEKALHILSLSGEKPVTFVSLTRLPHWEKDYTWITSLFSHKVRVMTYSKPAPQTIDEAKHLQAGVISGSGAISLVEELGFTKIEKAATALHNVQKLKSNQLEMIIESDIVNSYYWKVSGYDPKNLKIGVSIHEKMNSYIVGNPNFPKNIAQKINSEMNKMIEDGTYDTIINKWTNETLTGVAPAKVHETAFMTHSIKGKTYISKNGELRGIKHMGRRAFNIELVREMMLLMHHPVRFKEIPLKRGQLELTKNNTALFNIARTEEREELYKWVGPLQIDNVYFYKAKKSTTNTQSLDDAKSLSNICVLRGTSQHENLIKYGFENIHENNTWSGCLKMLAAGRVDLVPLSDSLLDAIIKEAKINPNNIEKTPVLTQVNAGYIAFSKDHPDSVIKKWQKTLDQLKESGEYDNLVKEYMNPAE